MAEAPAERRSKNVPPRGTELTNREWQVMNLVCVGATNQQIGRALCIAPATAKSHVSRIMARLGLSSRVQAAVVLTLTKAAWTVQGMPMDETPNAEAARDLVVRYLRAARTNAVAGSADKGPPRPQPPKPGGKKR